MPTRRQFLVTTGLVAAGVGAYSFGYEPRHLVAENREIRLRRLPPAFDGLRIAQLTDVHFGTNVRASHLEHAVRLARDFQPDLVLHTGDFVVHPFGESHGPKGARFAEPCGDILSTLKPPLGNFAILGNHDHWNDATIVTGALQERHITVLRNANHAIERDGARIWLAGIDDAFVGAADFDAALAAIPGDEFTLLMAHEPDTADHASRFPVDLQLSGHSHGGQVKLPFVGPLILPALAQKYPEGWYSIGNLQLYTSRGVGLINPPVRFNCPAEVTLLTLRSS